MSKAETPTAKSRRHKSEVSKDSPNAVGSSAPEKTRETKGYNRSSRILAYSTVAPNCRAQVARRTWPENFPTKFRLGSRNSRPRFSGGAILLAARTRRFQVPCDFGRGGRGDSPQTKCTTCQIKRPSMPPSNSSWTFDDGQVRECSRASAKTRLASSNRSKSAQVPATAKTPTDARA